MKKQPLAISAPAQNLQRLLVVRGFFILAVCAALIFCHWQLQLPLNYSSMLFIISGLTLINVFAFIQLRFYPYPSTTTVFTQLIIEITGISLLLFYVGGADNPFVSYFLVPLCIAAAILPWRLVWPLILFSLSLYTALFFYRIPLPDIAPHHNHGGGISLHTTGMWFNFLLSVSLITFFIVRMAAALRHQTETLNRLKEDRLRDEQILAVASLAAGTAHELGTPLTTIKTLLNEIQSEYQNDSNLSDDIQLLQSQVAHCTDTLHNLKTHADLTQNMKKHSEDVAHYCHQLIDNWLLLHPETEASIAIDSSSPDIQAYFHPSISQAIVNLLNNASEANPVGIEIHAHWNHEKLSITIKDQGLGISDQLLSQLGAPLVSEKGSGRGLGLFLTKATLERHHGSLQLTNHPTGGCLASLSLPLTRHHD
jgi:two-component system sensor histidine kinase RegB